MQNSDISDFIATEYDIKPALWGLGGDTSLRKRRKGMNSF